MKNIHKVLLVFQVLLISVFVQQAQGEPYLHRATGIVFPDKIAGFENTKVTDYEAMQPGLGIGISYRQPKIRADIYLYKGGLSRIPEGINSSLITQHFQQCVNDIHNGGYSSVKKLSAGEISLGNQPALSASFSYSENDIEEVSYLYLTGYDNHFLKIRFTYFKSAETSGKASLAEFLEKIGKLLVNLNNQ